MTCLEALRLAPAGSGKARPSPPRRHAPRLAGTLLTPPGPQVREMLRQGQLGLVMGGEMGTFTPMYYIHAKKA